VRIAPGSRCKKQVEDVDSVSNEEIETGSEIDQTRNSPDPSYEEMEALFKRELVRRRKVERLASAVYIFFGVFVVALAVIWIVYHYMGVKFKWPQVLPLFNIFNFSICVLARMLSKNGSKYIQTVRDKRAVGPLIDMLAIRDHRFGYDEKTRELAIRALNRLLPEIGESDDVVLNAERRKVLGSLMLKEADGKFVVAAIEALAKTGRTEVVRNLEAVVVGKAKYAGKDAQDAGQRALLRVQDRIEQEKAHAILLRPSDSAPALDPNLLRPADGVTPSNSAALLRPTGDSESESLNQQA
jgi:hypothetical protein